jgi:S1-C subfamily serine protease
MLLVGSEIAAAQQPANVRLGVRGHFEQGYGMVIDSVRWRGAAARIGLEPGDVIRSINGRWLRTEADYRRQLRAKSSVRLVVEDVRTGRLIARPIELNDSSRNRLLWVNP